MFQVILQIVLRRFYQQNVNKFQIARLDAVIMKSKVYAMLIRRNKNARAMVENGVAKLIAIIYYAKRDVAALVQILILRQREDASFYLAKLDFKQQTLIKN